MGSFSLRVNGVPPAAIGGRGIPEGIAPGADRHARLGGTRTGRASDQVKLPGR